MELLISEYLRNMTKSNIAKIRESCQKALAEKLGEKSAVKYETAIYNMCVRIAKRDGDGITVEHVYPEVAFDKVGQLMVATAVERTKILNDLKNTVEDWDSCVYFEQQTEYNKCMNRAVEKPTAVKGVYKCNNKGCKSDDFYMWSVQTKSGDEGMTQYRRCAICGKQKKE